MIELVALRDRFIETVGCDVGVTKEDDLVGGFERQVDKETVGVLFINLPFRSTN
jgi:hypothetical protein